MVGTTVTFDSTIGATIRHKDFKTEGIVRGFFSDRDGMCSALVEHKTTDGKTESDYWREEDIE